MWIISELGLDNPQIVQEALDDFSSDKQRIKNDLRIYLEQKQWMTDISEDFISALITKEIVIRILFGSLISEAVISHHGATSRQAQEIMWWTPGEMPFDDTSDDWEWHDTFFRKVA